MFCAFNLTEALAILNADNAAVAAYVKAWGLEQDPVNKAATAAQVHNAAESKEQALDAAITTLNGLNLSGTVETTTVQTISTTYDENDPDGSKDAIEDAQLAIVKLQIAAAEKALDKNVTTATTNLDAVSTSLKAAADAYYAATNDATAAGNAVTVAEANLANALASLKAGSAGDITVISSTGIASNSTDVTVTITSGAQGKVEAIYTTATGVWTYQGAGAVADDTDSGAPAGMDLTAVKAAVEAEFAAEKAKTAADELVQTRKDGIAKLDGDQFTDDTYTVTKATTGGVTLYAKDATSSDANWTDAANATWVVAETLLSQAHKTTVAGATTGETVTYKVGSATLFDAAQEASLYLAALKDVADFDKQVAKVTAAEDAVTAARADSVELTSLEKEVTSSTKVLTDAGYTVTALANGSFSTGTAKNDLFSLGTLKADGDKAIINDFSFVGDDMISIGSDYTFNSGKMATAGDNSVLEMFAVQSGANVVLSFETTKFGSNVTPDANDADITAAGGDQLFSITLTGVSLADLHVSNGFVTLA